MLLKIRQKYKTAVPAISPRNRHRPEPKGTIRYIHSITGPIPALSKTDKPGVGVGTMQTQEAPTTTDPYIAAQYRP